MNDLLARINALAAAKQRPDAATLAQLRAEFGQLPPDVAANLHALLDNLLAPPAPTAPIPPSPQPGGAGLLNWKTLLVLVGGLVGGGAVTESGVLPSLKGLAEQVRNVEFPSWYALLGAVAGVGAVVGFGYSSFHNRKVVFPAFNFNRQDRSLTIDQWGFLDEMLFGAGAAVITCWTAISAAQNPPYLLTGGMIVSAVTAGVIGARMRAGMEDRGLLWDKLAGTVVSPPAAAGAAAEVKNAPTAREAVKRAEDATKPAAG